MPQPPKPTISIVIVVWNAQKYVLECLDSLRKFLGCVSAEVIIVDNASTDGTPDLVTGLFPEYKLMRNSENLGFAKANNIGIAECSGEYICLVNSDVKFVSDCFSPILRYLAENPEIALLGPKCLNANGKVRRSTMRFPTVWNYFCRSVGLDSAFPNTRFFGGLLMADFDHLTTIPVEVLVGWFVVARRSALERVGLLDSRFFIYGEDVDWCYRFHEAGEKVVFFAGAEAIHYGGGSSSNAPLRFYLEMCYANWQYWKKHSGWAAQRAFLASLVLHHVIRLTAAAWEYLLAPSQRPNSIDRLKRSVTCLHWVCRRERNPLEMGIDLGSRASTTAARFKFQAKMSFRSQLGRVRTSVLCALHCRCVSLGDRGPIVSFSFDDFPRSAYSVGGAILEEFGARGTYYATVGLMNRSNDLGDLFTAEDVQSLLAKGHELASQTFDHSSCRSVSLSEFQNDVQKGRVAVEQIAAHSSSNFAYPYGHVTLRAKKALGTDLASSRGIVPGFNGPEIDLNLLRANKLYGDVDETGQVEELIRQNVEQKSWLIFYTHDVRPVPSVYGCTPELFEAAVSLARHSGSRILTVQQVLSEIGVGNGYHPKGHACSAVCG